MLLTTSRAKNGKKIYKTRPKPLIRKETRKSYDEYARLNLRFFKPCYP